MPHPDRATQITDDDLDMLQKIETLLFFFLVGALILGAITLCVTMLFELGHLSWLAFQVGLKACKVLMPPL